MPNSEVKPLSADDSVGSPHVKVGHRQAFITKPSANGWGFFYVKKYSQFPIHLLRSKSL